MKKLIFIIALLLSTTLTAQAGFFDWLGFGDNVGGGMGTLEMLNQWRSTTDGITTNSSGKTIYAPLSDAYFANLTVGGIATTTTLCFADNTCQTTAVGALTPWTENIDGGGFNLTNVGYISADTGTSTISNLNVTGDLTVGANIYGSFTFVTSGDLQVDNIKLSGNTIEATNDSGLNIFDNASNGLTVKDGGNIGIGTTAPSEKLEVSSGVTNIATLITDRSILFRRDNDGVYDNQGLILDPTTHTLSLKSSGGGGEVDIYDNTGQVMRITGGNVGIGTTEPGAKLHVTKTSANKPNIIAQLDAGYGISGIRLRNEYNARNFDIVYSSTSSSATSGLYFNFNTNAIDSNFDTSDSLMTILRGGNVGIGTTAPVDLLELAFDSEMIVLYLVTHHRYMELNFIEMI